MILTEVTNRWCGLKKTRDTAIRCYQLHSSSDEAADAANGAVRSDVGLAYRTGAKIFASRQRYSLMMITVRDIRLNMEC